MKTLCKRAVVSIYTYFLIHKFNYFYSIHLNKNIKKITFFVIITVFQVEKKSVNSAANKALALSIWLLGNAEMTKKREI